MTEDFKKFLCEKAGYEKGVLANYNGDAWKVVELEVLIKAFWTTQGKSVEKEHLVPQYFFLKLA